MDRGPKIVLQLPLADAGQLAEFVEQCLRDRACLIAIQGEGCGAMEDEIDRLIVRDGSDESRFITTTSHPGETLEETLEFAEIWGDPEDEVRLVRL